MAWTITVKGVGTATVKPDYVVLTLSVEAKNMDYNAAMQRAAYKVDECMPMMAMDAECSMPDIGPNDIKANDAATFVWAIS